MLDKTTQNAIYVSSKLVVVMSINPVTASPLRYTATPPKLLHT